MSRGDGDVDLSGRFSGKKCGFYVLLIQSVAQVSC